MKIEKYTLEIVPKHVHSPLYISGSAVKPLQTDIQAQPQTKTPLVPTARTHAIMSLNCLVISF